MILGALDAGAAKEAREVEPRDRAGELLGKLASVQDMRSQGCEVSDNGECLYNKFVIEVERVFSALPKPIEWRSFYNHDLPLVTDLDREVREWAIANKLNKSQAKELGKPRILCPHVHDGHGRVVFIVLIVHVGQAGGQWREWLLSAIIEIGEPRPVHPRSSRGLKTMQQQEKSRTRSRNERSWGAHLTLRERHKTALETIAAREDTSLSHIARRVIDAGLTALYRDEEAR